MKLLITGAGSGLGRHLHERLGGEGLTRENASALFKTLPKTGVETIIHCAASSRRGITSDPLYSYLEDNLFLTQRLVSLPHKKFVYLSSVSVYPDTPGPHREGDSFPADAAGGGVYGMTKLMSEAIVAERACDPLILRPVFMLDRHSRPGNLVRILTDADPELDLSGRSTFNCVTHSDVETFIALALKKNLGGIYNAAANDSITLSEAAKLAGKNPSFGKGLYTVPVVDNRKIVAVCPLFDKSSKRSIEQFLSRQKPAR
ncbi:MAG: NAD-dependent epimerase/dehydratase family protein [Elusimicrobia bacterium]|nr:NAD-dependent epimerase/dehydratase family protein [Elusimicrobiota bacterium]